jgi:hypothetical protein
MKEQRRNRQEETGWNRGDRRDKEEAGEKAGSSRVSR